MIIVGFVVFCVVFWFLVKGLTPPPVVETTTELQNQGYSIKEAKVEARKQRDEQRQHSRTQGQAMRTAKQVARASTRMMKRMR